MAYPGNQGQFYSEQQAFQQPYPMMNMNQQQMPMDDMQRQQLQMQYNMSMGQPQMMNQPPAYGNNYSAMSPTMQYNQNGFQQQQFQPGQEHHPHHGHHGQHPNMQQQNNPIQMGMMNMPPQQNNPMQMNMMNMQQQSNPMQRNMMPSSVDQAQVIKDVQTIQSVTGSNGFLSSNRKDELVAIYGSRSNAHMEEVIRTYKATFGQDLHKRIESKESGLFARLLADLSTPLARLDADNIHKACKGMGCDEKLLSQTIVGRTNQEIKDMDAAYREEHKGKSLEHIVGSETSGHYKQLMVALVQGGRDQQNKYTDAQGDADALFQAGSARMVGCDESVFISILSTRSESHLRQVFLAYFQTHGMHILTSIHKNFSGNTLYALELLVKKIEDRPAYVAEQLHEAMKGMGTDEERIIYLTVYNRAVPLVQYIRDNYRNKHRKELTEAIASEVRGEFRNLLVAIYSQ